MQSFNKTRFFGNVMTCVVVTICMAGATPAHAVTYTWTGGFSDSFFTGGNWTPSGGPPNDSADTARFTASPSHEYTVSWSGDITNKSLHVESGVLVTLWGSSNTGFAKVYTLDSTLGSAFIGLGAGPLCQLTLSDNGQIGHSIEATGYLVIGNGAGSNGRLILDGFDWSSTSYTYVGNYGLGYLEADSWSTLTNTSGTLGVNPGSSGVAAVSGSWINTSTLRTTYASM